MTTAVPALNFLTTSGPYTDFRPSVGSNGDVVVFERTPLGSGETLLYTITDLDDPDPVPFFGPKSSAPPTQTRPDFCWQTGDIAFNGSLTNALNSPADVWLASSEGADATKIPNTKSCYYPAWSVGGSLFVTDNTVAEGIRPCNTVFDTTGMIPPGYANIDGTDAAGAAVFGAMAAVGPKGVPQIAFAGQPAVVGWAGSSDPSPRYNQDYNYVFLNTDTGNDVFTSAPMESDASITTFDPNHQGRAPAWSPDGSTIAFESNREGGYAIYLCDLASGVISQVTWPMLGAQHAKFFPCGTKLIFAIQYQNTPSPIGIAWVDISALLKS